MEPERVSLNTREINRLRRKKKLGLKRQIVILIWSVIFAWLSLTSDSASLDSVKSDGIRSGLKISSGGIDPDHLSPSKLLWTNADTNLIRSRRDVSTGDDKGNNMTREEGNIVTSVSSSSNILKAEINDSSSSLPLPSSFVTAAPNAVSPGISSTTSTFDPLDDPIPGVNCTLPGITEFPEDLFTQAQRRQGYLAVHFLASIYIFYSLALVCDEFFVPSIECICDELHLPSDVAGATFMAIATSSPELFTNIVGTFITKGDIGVGTIVGSAVFNILAVSACCGLAAQTALPLEWYPLTRDCLFYSISVILLIVVLNNRQVFWYEALALVLAYAVYITVMYNNTALKRKTEGLVGSICKKMGFSKGEKSLISGSGVADGYRRKSRRTSFVAELTSSTEKTPLLAGGVGGGKPRSRSLTYTQSFEETQGIDFFPKEKNAKKIQEDITAEDLDNLLITKALHNLENAAEEGKDEWGLFSLPEEKTLWILTQWFLSWPARFILTFTVPDCRESRLRKWYPITFLMCIVWIASLSYVVSWMMTIIGHTLRIPDSVMGLTFIAAGTSIPEAVSSIIVARQGLGTMSISNSIGSNTFDILVCLGLPWLIRGALIANEPKNYIQINSGGLEYSAMILMASLIMLYSILACNKFYLDKKVGIIALSMYGAFLVFASLFEMNVFFTVNLPTCEILD